MKKSFLLLLPIIATIAFSSCENASGEKNEEDVLSHQEEKENEDIKDLNVELIRRELGMEGKENEGEFRSPSLKTTLM